MTDHDFSIEGMTPEPSPRDARLERRIHGFGCSELAALFVKLELRASDGCTKKIIEDGRMLFSRKARGVSPAEGKRLDREHAADLATETAVLNAWVERGCPGTDAIPSSIRHASSLPAAWLPIVDRVEPRLRCSPDSWGVEAWGDDIYVELKSTFNRYYDRPWAHALQTQGAMAVLGAKCGVVVCGPGWVNEPGGDLIVWPIERNEALIAEIREACAEGWKRVTAMKEWKP